MRRLTLSNGRNSWRLSPIPSRRYNPRGKQRRSRSNKNRGNDVARRLRAIQGASQPSIVVVFQVVATKYCYQPNCADPEVTNSILAGYRDALVEAVDTGDLTKVIQRLPGGGYPRSSGLQQFRNRAAWLVPVLKPWTMDEYHDVPGIVRFNLRDITRRNMEGANTCYNETTPVDATNGINLIKTWIWSDNNHLTRKSCYEEKFVMYKEKLGHNPLRMEWFMRGVGEKNCYYWGTFY
jgi:hypothetical protein